MPLEIDPITIAPSSADQTKPRPPNRLVPAITGPAIASSSTSPLPDCGFHRQQARVTRMPPAAASVKPSMNTDLDPLHPDARPPGGPPRFATAKMWRP